MALAGCTQQDRSPATGASTAVRPVDPPVVADAIPDHYDQNGDPATDLARALRLAAADRKQVLLVFGANWCPDCRVLDKLFASDTTEPVLRRGYHVVLVDVGRWNKNETFTARYVDLSKSGIPALAVLTPAGRVLQATNDGSFADARRMTSDQVNAFLLRWASAGPSRSGQAHEGTNSGPLR